MIIWGRIIGTLLGLKFLGFFGAVVGFLIGNWFDRGVRLHLHHMPRGRSLAVQQAFFRTTFLVMGHLAKADGHVNENEIRIARRMMSQLDLNEDLKKEAIELFTAGKEQNFDLNQALSGLIQECGRYPDLLRFFIEIQLEVGLSDGALNSEESRILLLICQKLQFSRQEFEQLQARQWASQAFYQWFSSQFSGENASYQYQFTEGQSQRKTHGSNSAFSLQDAYGVLGIQASVSNAEVKKAYRRLMHQHHPDKLSARGLPDSMIKLAKEKTQAISAAYELVRKERGFR